MFDRLFAQFFPPAGAAKPKLRRSLKWPALSAAHLKAHPFCAACGITKFLVPHHILPVHLFPELELDPANLLTLCESPTHNDHLLVGHLLHYASYNPEAAADAAVLLKKIRGRPRWS